MAFLSLREEKILDSVCKLPLDYRIEREDRYGGITANASIDGYEIY